MTSGQLFDSNTFVVKAAIAWPPRPRTYRVKRKPPSSGTGFSCAQHVRLDYFHPTAQRVDIAATFNDWHPGVTRMIYLGEGRWAKVLVLPPATYRYALVVDGKQTEHTALLRVPENGAHRGRDGLPSCGAEAVDGESAEEETFAAKANDL